MPTGVSKSLYLCLICGCITDGIISGRICVIASNLKASKDVTRQACCRVIMSSERGSRIAGHPIPTWPSIADSGFGKNFGPPSKGGPAKSLYTKLLNRKD